MHILGVLDLLEKLETKISELYEWFSRNYAYDAGATSLFYRISIDEIAHANLVRYEKKLAVQNSKIFSEIHLDVVEISTTLEKVISVLSGTPPSLEQAVKISLDIENSAAEAHYRNAIAKATPEISRLLKNLGGFDSRHLEVFSKFAESRGYPFVPKSQPSLDREVAVDIKTDETRIPIPPEVLERIWHFHDSLKSMDFYKLLGIMAFASNDQIKKAFRSLAHEFHPDSFMNAGEEIQQKLNTIMAHVTHAYTTLMDPVKKRNYDMTLTRPRK
jgi:rubrerythrin